MSACDKYCLCDECMRAKAKKAAAKAKAEGKEWTGRKTARPGWWQGFGHECGYRSDWR